MYVWFQTQKIHGQNIGYFYNKNSALVLGRIKRLKNRLRKIKCFFLGKDSEWLNVAMRLQRSMKEGFNEVRHQFCKPIVFYQIQEAIGQEADLIKEYFF